MYSGKMFYAKLEGTYVIQLTGDVRVSLCSTLEHFLDEMFGDPTLDAVLIDLTKVTGIDSTTLGILAKISLFLSEHVSSLPTIISTNPDVTRILENMGFEQVFHIIRERPIDPIQCCELPTLRQSERDVCKKVLDAHRTLMEMNDNNKSAFQPVVAALEMEQQAIAN